MSSFPFIPEDASSFHGISVTISAGLSLLGCIFIFITYIYFRYTQQIHFKLILFLTLTDLIIGVLFIIGIHGPELNLSDEIRPYLCSIPDTLIHTCIISSFVWTMCIAHMLVQVIRYRNDRVDSYFPFYCLFSLGIPLIILGMLTIRGVIGWKCKDRTMGAVLYGRLLFFIPLVVSYGYNIYCYIVVSNKLSLERFLLTNKDSAHLETLAMAQSTPKILRTYRVFLLAFVVVWVWALLIMILERFDVKIMVLYDINYIFTPMAGFLNSLVYGMNDELRSSVNMALKRMCPCCFVSPGQTWDSHTYEQIKDSGTVNMTIDNQEFIEWRAKLNPKQKLAVSPQRASVQ
eukprot:TRINITY_DN1038_c0_g1_i2.p1 TRINITY_DN1038_c0_g1~~TRINITY_DN1038_c0_g1_i2.p1  ORF type:complete len:346 (+),score=34.26 TRINITY_DN1038_c0_g1_i2:372-1409(+)